MGLPQVAVIAAKALQTIGLLAGLGVSTGCLLSNREHIVPCPLFAGSSTP